MRRRKNYTVVTRFRRRSNDFSFLSTHLVCSREQEGTPKDPHFVCADMITRSGGAKKPAKPDQFAELVEQAAQRNDELMVTWRHEGDREWQTNRATAGRRRTGALVIRLDDGPFAGQTVPFPHAGVEYYDITLEDAIAELTQTSASMVQEQAHARRERQQQARTIAEYTDAIGKAVATAGAQTRAMTRAQKDMEVERTRTQERERELLQEQATLRSQYAMAMTELATERQALADAREELTGTLEVARRAVTDASAEQAEAMRSHQKEIEQKLEEVKRSQNQKRDEEKRERDTFMAKFGQLEGFLRDARDKSLYRADRLDKTLTTITERLAQLEQREPPQELTALAQVVQTLAEQVENMRRDNDTQTLPKRAREKDEEEAVAATDVEDETSCGTANQRWSRLEKQLPSNERAAGPYAAIVLSPEVIESEWRRRLMLHPKSPSHYREIVEQFIQAILNTHRVASLTSKHRVSEVLRYAAHKQLRLMMVQGARLQLQIASAVPKAYNTLATDLAAAMAKNRRNKNAFVGQDVIVSKILATRQNDPGTKLAGARRRRPRRGQMRGWRKSWQKHSASSCRRLSIRHSILDLLSQVPIRLTLAEQQLEHLTYIVSTHQQQTKNYQQL